MAFVLNEDVRPVERLVSFRVHGRGARWQRIERFRLGRDWTLASGKPWVEADEGESDQPRHQSRTIINPCVARFRLVSSNLISSIDRE